MTLQPLVENAIYHGVKPKRGISRICISSLREAGKAVLRVEDTGIGMSQETLKKLREALEKDEGTGFGMLASYKRLKLMYGTDLEFQIDSEENRGSVITIRMPIHTEENG